MINYEEWTDFTNVFLNDFKKCDKDNDLYISADEINDCLSIDKFKRMMEFNKNFTDDTLQQTVLQSLSLNGDVINLYEYIQLRNYNNAYDICLMKENKFYYKNFAVAVKMVIHNLYVFLI